MKPEREVADAHLMLDRLGADGRSGSASIRERFSSYLDEMFNGRPVPTRETVGWAQYGTGINPHGKTRAQEAKT